MDATDGSCTDTDHDCERWAAAGECAANPDYMNFSCSKSCGCAAEQEPPQYEWEASGLTRCAPLCSTCNADPGPATPVIESDESRMFAVSSDASSAADAAANVKEEL